MTRYPVPHVPSRGEAVLISGSYRGLKCAVTVTHLDRVIDHSFPHIDDTVPADVGDGAPVEATHHPLLPLDGQVGVHDTLTIEFNKAFPFFCFEGTYFVLLLSSSHLHSHLDKRVLNS